MVRHPRCGHFGTHFGTRIGWETQAVRDTPVQVNTRSRFVDEIGWEVEKISREMGAFHRMGYNRGVAGVAVLQRACAMRMCCRLF